MRRPASVAYEHLAGRTRSQPHVLDCAVLTVTGGHNLADVSSWRWRAEPHAVLGFSKRLGKTVLLDLEAAMRLRDCARSHNDSLDRAIALAAAQSAPIRSFAVPETLHVELTRACPFQCPACYLRHKSETAALAWTRLESILREAVALGVLQVALGGGEPLLYPDLERTVSLAAAQGTGVSLTTSGFGATAARLQGLKDLGLDHLTVSMPLMAGTHDPRLSESASSALDLAKDARLSIGVNVIVTRSSIEHLYGFVAGLTLQDVCDINLLRPKPASESDTWFRESRLRGRDWDALAHEVARIKSDFPTLRLRLDSAMSPVVSKIVGSFGPKPLAGCGAGRRFMAVNAFGHFKPCSHLHDNDYYETIHSYWWESPYLQDLRQVEDKIGAPCCSCDHRSQCRGCRAVTGRMNGDTDCWRALQK